MGINDNPLGVSGTTLSGLGDQNGALYQFLKQTSGGSSNAQRAIDLAGQLVPQYQEVNPWEVAFQYFAEMGRQASQPGATAFGAAVGSMQVPLDYLNAKKKEKRESDSARLQTALTLGPSLKPEKATGAGTAVKVVGPNGTPIWMSSAEAIKTGAEPWEKDSTSTTTSTGSYVFQSNDAYNRFKVVFPKVAETLTEGQRAGTEPLIINKNLLTDPNLPNIFKEPPTADPSGSAASEIAKLYDDLNTAKDEASKDAEAFLLANPLATTEEISAAAQNNPAFAEAQTLQEKINSLAAASGFNRELYSAESELRKEWRKLKDPFNDISAGHKKLIASLEAQTGVGDMSAIFAYMKMLDENSVVRESEFQSAQNTSGLYQSLLTKYNQLKAGNMLSPTQRAEFMNLANQFYKVTEQFIDKNRLDLGITVSTYPNLNPRSVFGGSEEAPNSFYSDAVVFRTARDSGFTMDELWREMTDDEKAEYLP
jgi:hypothetical protein